MPSTLEYGKRKGQAAGKSDISLFSTRHMPLSAIYFDNNRSGSGSIHIVCGRSISYAIRDETRAFINPEVK